MSILLLHLLSPQLFLESYPFLLSPQWAIECLLRGSLCSLDQERAAAADYLQRVEAALHAAEELKTGDGSTTSSGAVDSTAVSARGRASAAAAAVSNDVSAAASLAAQYSAERAALLRGLPPFGSRADVKVNPHEGVVFDVSVGAEESELLSEERVTSLAFSIADRVAGKVR